MSFLNLCTTVGSMRPLPMYQIINEVEGNIVLLHAIPSFDIHKKPFRGFFYEYII
jgi:hypothetical protein